MKTEEYPESFQTEDGEPDVRCMIKAIDDVVKSAGPILEKIQRDTNTRNARWDDQSDTGRKPQTVGGREAEPWPGASDCRIRLADEFINDDVKLCKSVTKRGKLRVKGRESGDWGNAGKVALYLGYLRDTQLRDEWKKQATLAAQWRQQLGYSLSLIDWVQEYAIAQEPMTVEQLRQIAQADPSGTPALISQLLMVPEAEADLVKLAVQLLPDATPEMAKERLDELRKGGATTWPRRYLRLNRPRRKALRPFRDVFHPIAMADVQTVPWIARRVFLTPEQVKEKAQSDEWSEAFIEALLKTTGKNSLDDALAGMDAQKRHIFQDSIEETKGLIEVFYFYYLETNEAGISERRRAVISRHMPKVDSGETGKEESDCPCGPDEPIGYDHGAYPFIEHRREDNDDALVENRGVPEILMTHQREIKDQRDARINQVELALQPPVIRPEREVGLKLMFRPRGEMGERKQASYRFGDVPPYQPGSVELEKAARFDAEQYFARGAEVVPARAGLYAQDMADDWAAEEAACWGMVLQLSQQFVDEIAFERVVGKTREPIKLSRDDIQGQFDITVQFDSTPMIDPDAIESRLGQLNQLVGMDRGGVINLAAAVKGIFALLFPDLADEALDDIETAGQREIDDEDNNWKSMLAGVEPPMADKGQNFNMRKMRLEQILANPENQRRAQEKPDTMEFVKRRIDHLKFMVEQFGANAQAGRVGVMPAGAGAAGQ